MSALIDLYESLRDSMEDWFSFLAPYRAVVYLISTAITGVVFFALLFMYDKFKAQWFGIPVWALSLVGALVVWFGLYTSGWFNRRRKVTPWILMVIALLGIGSCLALGIHFTEPVGREAISRGYQYEETRTGSSVYYYRSYFFGGGQSYSSDSDFDAPDIDVDDDMAEVIIVIALIAAIIVLLTLSAFVPHFWVFAVTVLLAWQAMFALREFLREYEQNN